MAEEEVRAWKTLGVTRDPGFLLPPSGSLDAAVACHLHCTPFSVADPYSRATCDQTNICMKQLMDIGFTEDRCLLYDHLFRREALDGFQLYPAEILRIHEGFTTHLRREMWAIVDVCWGSYVQKRVKETCTLIPLPLWGSYESIELWLECEDDERTQSDTGRFVRFVVFLLHPQAMLYAPRGTKGRLQDLYLSIISKLAGMSLDETFYEFNHKPGTYGRLEPWEYRRQQEHNASAIREVASVILPKPNDLGEKSLHIQNARSPADLSIFQASVDLTERQTDLVRLWFVCTVRSQYSCV